MTIMVEAGGWPVGSSMIGVAVWVMFGLWWWALGRGGESAQVRLASFGGAMAAALVGGFGLGAWLGGGASSLGALLGAGVVAAVAWWTLGDDAEVRRTRWLGAALVAGFAALAVARLGCVVAGCDFGFMWEDHAPIAQRHARTTAAWEFQVLSGVLAPTSMWSRPTFPFAAAMALNFALGAFLTSMAIRLRGASSGWVPATGSLALLGAAALEFTRAPGSVHRWVGPLPASALMYCAGAVGLLFLAMLWWRDAARALRIPPGSAARSGTVARGKRQQ